MSRLLEPSVSAKGVVGGLVVCLPIASMAVTLAVAVEWSAALAPISWFVGIVGGAMAFVFTTGWLTDDYQPNPTYTSRRRVKLPKARIENE